MLTRHNALKSLLTHTIISFSVESLLPASIPIASSIILLLNSTTNFSNVVPQLLNLVRLWGLIKEWSCLIKQRWYLFVSPTFKKIDTPSHDLHNPNSSKVFSYLLVRQLFS